MLDEQPGEKTGSEANGPQLTRKKVSIWWYIYW